MMANMKSAGFFPTRPFRNSDIRASVVENGPKGTWEKSSG